MESLVQLLDGAHPDGPAIAPPVVHNQHPFVQKYPPKLGWVQVAGVEIQFSDPLEQNRHHWMVCWYHLILHLKSAKAASLVQNIAPTS
jgi:hypothetical protein